MCRKEMIQIVLILLMSVSYAVSDKCVRYTFEQNYEEWSTHDWGHNICTSDSPGFWIEDKYSKIGLSAEYDKSTTFIRPTPDVPSCVSSFNFTMHQYGIVEMNVYVEKGDNIVTHNSIFFIVQTTDGFLGNGMIQTNEVENGWYTIKTAPFSLVGIYEGHIVITGFASKNSIVLVDSFRYIPPNMDENDCRLYEDETTIPETSTDETSTQETSTDETSTDETSTQETSTDETSTQETSTDETSTDETSTQETSTDETRTDETSTQETSTDETSTDETSTQETSTDETSTDETSTQETSTDETSTDDTSTQETSTDETSTDETSTQETSTDETSTQETSTDETSTEETSTDETSTQETSTYETSTDDTSTQDTSTDETSTDETSTDETSTDETSTQETSSPETGLPETSSPETSSQQTTTQETSSQLTTTQKTSSLETSTQETSSLETSTQETITPEPEPTTPESTTAVPVGIKGNKGFWTPLTITMVVFLSLIVVTSIFLLFYQIRKIRAIPSDDSDSEDLPSAFRLPKVKYIYSDGNRKPLSKRY